MSDAVAKESTQPPKAKSGRLDKLRSIFKPEKKAKEPDNSVSQVVPSLETSTSNVAGPHINNVLVGSDARTSNSMRNAVSSSGHSSADISEPTAKNTLAMKTCVPEPKQNVGDPAHVATQTASSSENHILKPGLSDSAPATTALVNAESTTKIDPNLGQEVRVAVGPISRNTTAVETHILDPKQQSFGPIYGLWNEAYDDLKTQEPELIEKYEAKLQTSIHGLIASAAPPISHVRRQELMESVVRKSLEQYQENTWKVKALGQEFVVKDAAKPLLKVIKWAKEYIDGALETNPLAATGWAGVMIFLPLLLNPSEQEKSLLEGLGAISDVLVRSNMQENLYFRRWEFNGGKNDREGFQQAHKGYRDTLKALYVLVLKYQATSVCYFTKNGGVRLLADMVKLNKWKELLQDVEKQDKKMCCAYDLLNDVRIEEEFEKLVERHSETLHVLIPGFEDISALRKAIDKSQRDFNRSELLGWLSSVDPSQNYNSACGKHESGTGKWLVRDNEDFGAWKKDPNSLMWLSGKAGSGKSVLSSSVIKHLGENYANDPGVAVAYFYFSFNDKQKQNAVEMLASIIKQICCCRPDTPPSMQRLELLKSKGQRPDLETLKKVMAETLVGFSNIYVVVDALDECPNMDHERVDLMKCLSDIHTNDSKNLHMFWTSRREKDIEISFKLIQSTSRRWDIELSKYKPAIDHDIGLYVDSTLSSASYNSWPVALKDEARKQLIEKSDGMFQYVSCQFDALRRLETVTKVRTALHDLPKGLDATYDRMLASIGSDYRKQVANVLTWLSFSLRPLLLDELAEIFILDPEAEIPFDDGKRLMTPGNVLHFLSGLVTEVPRNLGYREPDHRYRKSRHGIEIRLAHFSIKEYLISDRISSAHATTFGIRETNAHIQITQSCLAYHLHLSKTIVATKETIPRYLLWEYVVQYWPRHLDILSEGDIPRIADRALEACNRASQSLLNMAQIYNPDDQDTFYPRLIVDERAPLYYACSTGSLEIVKILLENIPEPMIDEVSAGAKFGTALQAVLSNSPKDCIAILRLLLDHGADVNVQGGEYGNALQAAACRGKESLVQLLLDKGATVNAQGGKYGNALQAAAAAYWGKGRLVQLLLDHGADVNAQGGEYGNALQAAAFRGNESSMQLLLDKGATVNAQGGKYGNALQAAAFEGNESSMQLLLDHGADVNAQGGEYGNALQAAACRGKESLVQLLLDKGATVNAQGGKYGNALQAAAAVHWGKGRLVQLLLDHGADVNAQGGEYGNALQAAAFEGNESSMQLLLNKGADVNAQGGEYGNALQAAAATYRVTESLAQLLLDSGADVNAQGGKYGNALQAAACHGNEALAQRLLNSGANMNAQGGLFGNALQAAVAAGYCRFAELLLFSGAKVVTQPADQEELLTKLKEDPYLDIEEIDRLRKFFQNPTKEGVVEIKKSYK